MSSWYTPPLGSADSSVCALPPNLPQKPPREHKPSKLLSNEENASVFESLGRDKLTLSTTVVQLLLPTQDQKHWQKAETGVACFVRDRSVRSYFIEVYSFHGWRMSYQQEIYNEFEYQMPQPFFLTFEGDQSMVGLNFADPQEADEFRLALDKVDRKRKRQHARNPTNLQDMNNSMGNMTVASDDSPKNLNETKTAPAIQSGKGTFFPILTSLQIKRSKNKKKAKIPKLTKLDISAPSNCQHVTGYGRSIEKSYEVGFENPIFQTVLQKAGIDIAEADEKTKKLIYRFIWESMFGHQTQATEINTPTDDISFVDGPPKSTFAQPPRPPVRNPVPPGFTGTPPGPVPFEIRSSDFVPPPPPPIPEFSGTVVVPPPPTLAIPKDKNPAGSEPPSGSTTGTNNELLTAIRTGIKLNPVKPQSSIPASPVPDTIANSLMQFLEKRRPFLENSSDESCAEDEQDTDHEEWD